jgi:hypothetical protein
MSVAKGAWVDRRAGGGDLVSQRREEPNARSRNLGSTGTKARTRVSRIREPRAELEEKLKARAAPEAPARPPLRLRWLEVFAPARLS